MDSNSSLENYSRYVRPELGRVLSALKLDIEFQKASGDQLLYKKNNQEISVADFLGGFGSTILGHNHPEILKTLQECQTQQRPQHSQASLKFVTAELGKNLNHTIKTKLNDPRDFVMTLANTGAEAVEVALKHALLEWQDKRTQLLHNVRTGLFRMKDMPPAIRTQIEAVLKKIEGLSPVVFALEKGFHGKTSGAVAVTENSAYRKMFIGSPLEVEFIGITDHERIKNYLLKSQIELVLSKDLKISFSPVAGLIYEPIQGEGGIEEISEVFLRTIFPLFKERHIPMICDEIQSGLYRTGKFLCSEWYGFQPDYILLGKSFGGAVAKISAAVIARDHYVDEFGWIHTSTFAEDDWSSLLAIKTLQVLASNEADLVARAGKFEKQVRAYVEQLQKEFPNVIQKVKGRGFFLGIEFNFDDKAPTTDMLQGFYEQGLASYIYMSYLLHKHDVRVGVTLSAPEVLRLEPSAFITEEAIQKLFAGLKDLCSVLSQREMLKLTQHLWQQDFTAEQLQTVSEPKAQIKESRQSDLKKSERHVGFLTHVLSPLQAQSLDKSLQHVSPAELDKFFKNYANQAAPFRYFQKEIQGTNGAKIILNLYGIMQPSSYFEESLRTQSPKASQLVQEAVDLARSHEMQYFGLGQFTSIVTENGLLLNAGDMAITTGNSLTAALTVEALKEMAKNKGLDLSKARVGVVGFTGNICNVLTQVLADDVPNLVLVHREAYNESKKFQEAVEILLQNSKAKMENLKLSNETADLKDCDIVVVGTNSSKEFIRNEHVKDGAIILDVSVPSNVHGEVRQRSDVSYFQGGLAKLPTNQVVDHPWVPLKTKDCFACMAETIVMGLLNIQEPYSLGRLNKKMVVESLQMAQKVGITLGGTR